MINLVISVAAYAAAGFFLIRGFQTLGILELMAAAVFTSIGKTYIKRYKESR